jgi:MFS family permease
MVTPRASFPSEPGLERNLRLVPVHGLFAGALVWTPVMVLYTRAQFGLDKAVFLASLYYLFVVVLEVPSGWMSDRFGRVLTLRFAAACWVVGNTCFALGEDQVWVIAAGYLGMAGGFASLSGTNVSFHFDSLDALGCADQFRSREARVTALTYLSSAVAAVLGGAAGLVDLRAPFVIAVALSLAQLALTFQMTEPSHEEDRTAGGLFGHVSESLAYVRSPAIAWLFFYGVAMVTLEHVAFTPLQPWLTEALGQSATVLGSTPLVSGLIIAGVSVVGALAARSTDVLARRIGVRSTLIGYGVLSAVIVTSMWLSTSLFILLFIAFRSVQGAAGPVVLNSAISPLTDQVHRATLLSLNSLAGRLGYGIVLLVISDSIGDDVQRALRSLTLVSWTLIVVLVVSAKITHRADSRL